MPDIPLGPDVHVQLINIPPKKRPPQFVRLQEGPVGLDSCITLPLNFSSSCTQWPGRYGFLLWHDMQCNSGWQGGHAMHIKWCTCMSHRNKRTGRPDQAYSCPATLFDTHWYLCKLRFCFVTGVAQSAECPSLGSALRSPDNNTHCKTRNEANRVMSHAKHPLQMPPPERWLIQALGLFARSDSHTGEWQQLKRRSPLELMGGTEIFCFLFRPDQVEGAKPTHRMVLEISLRIKIRGCVPVADFTRSEDELP